MLIGSPVALVNVAELGVPRAPPDTKGVAPFDAAVIRPCASTVIDALVYEPAVTAVLSRFSVTVSVADATDDNPVPPLIVSVSLRSNTCGVPLSPATVTVAFCRLVKFASPSTKESAEPLPALVTITGLVIFHSLYIKKGTRDCVPSAPKP